MFEKLFKRNGYVKAADVKRNFTAYRHKVRSSFAAAATSNLYSSWTVTNYSADNILKMDLATLRARSRELERNNPFAKRAFGMIVRKVIGKKGFTLQARTKDKKGEVDVNDNALIEAAFNDWKRAENCDVTGRLSFRDIQKQVFRHIIRDGEVIIRKIKFANNKYAFSLQLMEADHLDENYNETLQNGNKIKMGIEFDAWGKPVAYHLWKQHPGDHYYSNAGYGERIRIPADEIIHLFFTERISASRGIPVIHAAMTEMNMSNGYMESELVAARVAASQMGVIENEEGQTSAILDDTENEDGTGNAIFDADPGTIRELGPGQKLSMFKPEHPTSQFEAFMKFILKAIASGMDVSYHALANDLADVNFSSLRAGEIEQRDVWHDLHEWFTEHFLTPVYEEWLLMALTSGALPVPFSAMQKFKNVRWQPRGFQWVDPRSESVSNALALANRINSPQNIIRDQGFDPDEILDDFQIWESGLEARGITTKTEAEIKKLVSETENDK